MSGQSYVAWYRREPWTGRIVLALFLWAPAWLVIGLFIGGKSAVLACMLVAIAPVALYLGWGFAMIWKGAPPKGRLGILAFLTLLVAFSLIVGWGEPLDY